MDSLRASFAAIDKSDSEKKEDEERDEHAVDVDNSKALEIGAAALGRVSAMISLVHLSCPMSQWIVDCMESVAEGLRDVAEFAAAIKFRVACDDLMTALDSKAAISINQLSLISGHIEKHTPKQSFLDKKTQESMSSLLDQLCFFEPSRGCCAEEAAKLGLDLLCFLSDSETAKLGQHADGMLLLQQAYHVLLARMKEIGDVNQLKLLCSKWEDTVGNLKRSKGKLSELTAEWSPKLTTNEKDIEWQTAIVGWGEGEWWLWW